eukprot:2205643-Rhodomonas_salina.2
MHPVQFRTWIKAVQAQLGIPKSQKFTVTATHLRAMMLLPVRTVTEKQDRAMVAVGTICTLRPSEIIALDLCDLLRAIDGPGILGLEILNRKNDKTKQGLRQRVHKANDLRLCLIQAVDDYMLAAGLQVSPHTQKSAGHKKALDALAV